MSEPVSPELFKKISSLRNLAQAISTVRKAIADQRVLEKDAKIIQLHPDKPADVTVEAATPKLEYIGRNTTVPGKISHLLGVRGSNLPHYELTMDTMKMGKSPSIKISHVSPNGAVLSSHPTAHSTMNEAIHSIGKHHKMGAW